MRRPLLHVAVAVLLVLAGCSVLADDPVREPAAVDRLNATQDRVDDVSSYRYNMTVNASSSGSSRRIDGHGVGAVNVTTKRKVINASLDGTRAVTYIDNRTAYTECQFPGTGWGRQSLSAESGWTELTVLGRQLALLSTGDLYHNGTERIDGQEVVHLSGRPTDDALSGDDGSSSVSVFDSSKADEVTVHLWVDAETNRPVRTDLRVVSRANDETATATLAVRYRGYGDPVRISIPEEARDPFYDTGCPGS